MSEQRPVKTGTYVSIVVETDGPIPGPYSLRGVGAAAVSSKGTIISSFETFILRLPGTSMHPNNSKYWAREPNLETYQKMDSLAVEPIDAISHLVSWTANLPGQPILVAYHAAFTWMWVHWYCTQYATRSPFTLGALDLKSQADPFLGTDFLTMSKADLPDSWRMEGNRPDSVAAKAEKQACILKSLINAKRTLSATFNLPAWTRATFGPSVREQKREARAASKLAKAT